jgi:hypothetical protein
MPTNVSWKLNLDVQSGPKLLVSNTVQVDAYDRIEVSVPDTSGTPTATSVDIQPGAAGKIKVLLIRSNIYGDNLTYQVHDSTTDERVLNDALFLASAGGLELLEDAATPLDKLLVTNTTGQDVLLEIIVGRSAI